MLLVFVIGLELFMCVCCGVFWIGVVVVCLVFGEDFFDFDVVEFGFGVCEVGVDEFLVEIDCFEYLGFCI